MHDHAGICSVHSPLRDPAGLAVFQAIRFCLNLEIFVAWQGPLENLLEHIDDPFGNNGLTLETAAKFDPSQ